MDFHGFVKVWHPRLEAAIKEYLGGNRLPHPFEKALGYLTLQPGKRIRPLLLLSFPQAFAAKKTSLALPIAVAIELVHSASLILDDLPSMDNAKSRRGKPCLHQVFGEDTAILVAFGLYAQAYALMIQHLPRLIKDEMARQALLHTFATVTGLTGMVLGQFLDLHPDKSMDFDTLEAIHRKKTAGLFVLAAELGASIAHLNPWEITCIKDFARNVGLAFQVQDDLFDEGQDEGQPKRLTFLSIADPQTCRELVEELLNTAEENLKPLGAKAKILHSFIQYVRERKY